MQRLLQLLRLFREYIVLSLLILVSLLILNSNNTRQLKEIRAYTIGFIGLMQNAFSIIPNVFELQRENQVLRQMNVNLTDEVNRLREARLENLKLRAMVGLKASDKYPLLAADVVAKSSILLRNTLTLNVGEADGVKTDMPIVSEGGLVGKIIASSMHYSIGQIMFNRDFRASAKIERSRVDGIIAWEGGEFLVMKNVPKKQDVLVGDIVLTSGYSNIFPPRIRIGRVIKVEERPTILFKDIIVESGIDFTRLEQVFVALQTPDTSRTMLEKQAALDK